MEVSGQLHAPTYLSSRIEPPVPIGWEAGWGPEPVWMLWWKEKSFAPAGNRIPIVYPRDGEFTGRITAHIKRLRFNPGAVNVGFVKDEVALGQGFLLELPFPLPITWTLLHTSHEAGTMDSKPTTRVKKVKLVPVLN
jgi:hypothetical protein